MTEKKIPPVHPGETLLEEFLNPMGISLTEIAASLNTAEKVVRGVVYEKQPVTADIALRLGRYFGMSPMFWLGLQNHYDLAAAEDRFEQQAEHRPRYNTPRSLTSRRVSRRSGTVHGRLTNG